MLNSPFKKPCISRIVVKNLFTYFTSRSLLPGVSRCFWFFHKHQCISWISPHCYYTVTVQWLHNMGQYHTLHQSHSFTGKQNISSHLSGWSTNTPVLLPPLSCCLNPVTDWCVFAEMRYPASLSLMCWQDCFFPPLPVLTHAAMKYGDNKSISPLVPLRSGEAASSD